MIMSKLAINAETATIPQTSFGHTRKVQNSLLRAISLYIYSMVYFTVEYLEIFRMMLLSLPNLDRELTIQAMSEFQSQSTH